MQSIIIPDKTWTLFLDRDGVINQRKIDDYVMNEFEFVWCDGALESICNLSEIFGRVIVVTNQQGIGKGLMTVSDLEGIHRKMINDTEKRGGRIDAVYYSPDRSRTGSFSRKPAPGMALKARKEFTDVNFRKSVMVGDTLNDMLFGKRLGMKTVFIETDKKMITDNRKIIDLSFRSLKDFSDYILKYTDKP